MKHLTICISQKCGSEIPQRLTTNSLSGSSRSSNVNMKSCLVWISRQITSPWAVWHYIWFISFGERIPSCKLIFYNAKSTAEEYTFVWYYLTRDLEFWLLDKGLTPYGVSWHKLIWTISWLQGYTVMVNETQGSTKYCAILNVKRKYAIRYLYIGLIHPWTQGRRVPWGFYSVCTVRITPGTIECL